MMEVEDGVKVRDVGRLTLVLKSVLVLLCV